MKTIQHYMDLAIERQELNSDRDLAKIMGTSQSTMTFWRTGKTLPSDEKMVNLSALAQVTPEEGLLALSYWRADGEAKSTYEKILRRISFLLPATLFGLSLFHPDKAFASQINDIAASPLPSESVSGLAIIMYITENQTKSAFNKAAQKQTLTKRPLHCVSRRINPV